MSLLDDVSKALIREVENDCAASDPDEIGDSAAMVLVGDVYSLRVCQEAMTEEPAKEAGTPPADDELSPFIR